MHKSVVRVKFLLKMEPFERESTVEGSKDLRVDRKFFLRGL